MRIKNKAFSVETSSALNSLFYRYTHLPIGGKEIVCPYWMNNLIKGIFGPYGGKGTPEQIVEATENEARKAGLNLNEMSEEETLTFMRGKKLGMDCSGFVFWMLDALDKEKGGNGIADDFLSTDLLPSRANVAMLTNEKIVRAVELKDVKVGDMIRLNKGKHVAIVMKVVKDIGNLREVREIGYAHSSVRTKTSGVHDAKIKITDQNKGLEAQKWNELASEQKNYGEACFFPDVDDGLKRLKTWV